MNGGILRPTVQQNAYPYIEQNGNDTHTHTHTHTHTSITSQRQGYFHHGTNHKGLITVKYIRTYIKGSHS